MYKIAICDDEIIFADKLKRILKKYLDEKKALYEIDVYSSGREFIDACTEIMNYDIFFLDINMEQVDGLQVAKYIRNISNQPYIVFVTAFINYALEGYNYNAVRYLLKTNNQFDDYVYECMDAIMEKMNYSVYMLEIDFIEGKRDITLQRIIFIESKLHKLEYHILEDSIGIYTQYTTLNAIEATFLNNNFIRVHQSFLVNMLHIHRLDNSDGKNSLIMSDGTRISIPKARWKEVKEKYVVYKGEF